jgi:trehalose utilization protein
MKNAIRVTVWNEYRHERQSPAIAALYPQGIHGTIAGFLSRQPGIEVRTATLDEPEHGLSDAVLAATDVLIWWGHMAHHEVQDAIVDKVQARVLNGMGLIVLHSGHFSKIFRRLMGTACSLTWREIGERERVWVVLPGHPIVEGLGPYFEIPHTEMYGEYFDIPQPDDFAPGHETLPIYHQPEVQKVITNAVRWAAPVAAVGFRDMAEAPNAPQPLEPILER